MKIGMLFPAYGSQYVGMCKDLYDKSRTVQEYFEDASQCLDINFIKLCFASSDVELSKITNAFPALFLTGAATAALIKEKGINIDYVAGPGIGEYAALSAASGLSLPDGLYLLSKLAQFYTAMRENIDVKSIHVNGLSTNNLNKLCKEHDAHIAIYENNRSHIVSGNTEDIASLSEKIDKSLVENIKIFEDGFHTPLLQELWEQIKIYLTKIDFKDLTIPLISNNLGKEILKGKKAQEAIINQIIKPMHWHNVMKQFNMVDLIIVPAPSKYLVAELSSSYPDKAIFGIDSMSDIEKLINYIDEHKEISLESSTEIPEEIVNI